MLLLLFEPRPLDQCSFFACALLYPGPISTFHSRSVVHSLCRLSAFGAGARFVRRPLARCSVFTFRSVFCLFNLLIGVLPLVVIIRYSQFTTLYRIYLPFASPFLFAHSINICFQKCTSASGEFHPIRIFFRYPLELLSSFYVVYSLFPHHFALFFFSLLLVLVTACATILYIFLYSRTAF